MDAASLVLATLSRAGWASWGAAVRQHRMLSAAVVAAETAFDLASRDEGAGVVADGNGTHAATVAKRRRQRDERRLKGSLMLVARLLAEPGSSAAALSALRRDRETARRLARIARAAQAHPDAMPQRVGKYFATLLEPPALEGAAD